MSQHPVNLLSAVNARRDYMRSFADAMREHNRAKAAIANAAPELVGHFTALAKQHLAYARALRTGDWSQTNIRPLSWFIAEANARRAAA